VGWSLLGAVLAAACFGVASVLQAVGAQAASRAGTAAVDPGLMVRLLGQWPFLLGLGLDLVGFLAELAALRQLPLFLVQSAVAASLAVTAVVAAWVMRSRLRGREWAAVAVVCGGLALLGLSAGEESAKPVGTPFRYGMLATVGVLAVAGLVAARWAGPAALGLVGGLGFGLVAVAARTLTRLAPAHLVRDPAAYTLVLAGVVAFFFYSTGLERGSVTTVTAAMVVGETVGPALIGVLVLGDHTRHGWPPVAVTGFVLAVAGALTLARHGEPAHDPAHDPAAPTS
jgi:drug/metabolite transporter (DMT)-like permease